MSIDELTHKIIGIAMSVHRELGPGFLETVYHRALEIELAAEQISFESEAPITVLYKEKPVGKFQADIVISAETNLLIELKAVENLTKLHETQTVNYLNATGIDDALLINFGTASLQFKHKFRTFRQKDQS